MPAYRFSTTPSIRVERGLSARLAEVLNPWRPRAVQIVTDAGVRAAGLIDPALDSLARAGIAAGVFDRVEADPSEAVINAAHDQAVATGADMVIGLGGGSSMDVAKLIALLAGGDGEALADIYGVGVAKGRRLPLVLIPTTAGTGSEVTPIAIVTTGAETKMGVVAPQLMPDVAILDAELTRSLPAPATAMTGIDAMVHAIEAYTSINPNRNPISRALAREALRLLGDNIAPAVERGGEDLDAREGMLVGAMLAGQAFANSPVGGVHALAYPIGALFHVPHGLSNALVLPPVMRFNAEACAADYAELAPILVPDADPADVDGASGALIDHLADLSRRFQLPLRLADVGIERGDLARLAADAMGQTRLLVNNPRPIDEADATAIYAAAL